MSIRRESEIESIRGNEDAMIKQFFHPHNTLNGINYSLAQFVLGPNKKTKRHKLKSSEIYYILEGVGKITIDKESFELKKNDSVYVPPMSEQFIKNTGSDNLQFLCIVEPAWKACDEIILE